MNGLFYKPYRETGITLADCPFCAGRPWGLAAWDLDNDRNKTEICVEVLDRYGEMHRSAFVICHECGARGPACQVCVTAAGTIITERDAMERAAAAWNKA